MRLRIENVGEYLKTHVLLMGHGKQGIICTLEKHEYQDLLKIFNDIINYFYVRC